MPFCKVGGGTATEVSVPVHRYGVAADCQPEANQRCRSPRAKVAWWPSLASGFDLDRSRLCLCGFRDGEAQHTIRETRLNLVGIKLARQRELALEVAHLIFLVDEAMPFGRMLVHLSMNGQGASLQRDRHAL